MSDQVYLFCGLLLAAEALEGESLCTGGSIVRDIMDDGTHYERKL